MASMTKVHAKPQLTPPETSLHQLTTAWQTYPLKLFQIHPNSSSSRRVHRRFSFVQMQMHPHDIF